MSALITVTSEIERPASKIPCLNVVTDFLGYLLEAIRPFSNDQVEDVLATVPWRSTAFPVDVETIHLPIELVAIAVNNVITSHCKFDRLLIRGPAVLVPKTAYVDDSFTSSTAAPN